MPHEGKKLPHRPERHVGRWAVSLGNELFKIEEAYTSLGDAHYLGTGLHGQRVTTACPTLVRPEDNLWLERTTHNDEATTRVEAKGQGAG